MYPTIFQIPESHLCCFPRQSTESHFQRGCFRQFIQKHTPLITHYKKGKQTQMKRKTKPILKIRIYKSEQHYTTKLWVTDKTINYERTQFNSSLQNQKKVVKFNFV